MPCLPSGPDAALRPALAAGWWRRCRALWLALLLALPLLWLRPAQAQQPSPTLGNLRFELTDDAVRMTGNLRFELSDAVQDTLSKGVPIFFVIETNTLRERWYWSDQNVFSSRRYVRLMYLPLLRKWRVNNSNEPFEGGVSKGVLLNQNYDSLASALQSIQRIAGWKVLNRSDWSDSASFNVDVRFRLDTSQLQRPLQFGTSGQSDWNLSVQRRYRLSAQDLGKVLN